MGKQAAIDLGSNSFHLMVVESKAGAFEILSRKKQRVALAAGLNAKQELSKEAMKRGLACLKLFKQHLEDFGTLDEVRIVATYTLRVASNAKDFCDKALKILGVPVRVISGHDEAELIYQGVAWKKQRTSKSAPILIVDIGGGSTEIIIGKGKKTHYLESFPMGCVSFTKKYFKDGTVCLKRYKKARNAAEKRVEEWLEKNDITFTSGEVTGTSGTVKAIAQAVHHRAALFEPISTKQLKGIRQCILRAKRTDRIVLDVRADRKHVLPAGLAILDGVLRALKVEEITYTDAALREGLIASDWWQGHVGVK